MPDGLMPPEPLQNGFEHTVLLPAMERDYVRFGDRPERSKGHRGDREEGARDNHPSLLHVRYKDANPKTY